MTALSDLLNNAKSTADINVDAGVSDATRAGHKINRATVYKVLRGDHAAKPAEATLEALAHIFRLDVRLLRDAVGAPRGELGPWVPPPEANRLDGDQRKALDQLIKTIVKVEEVVERRTTSSARLRAVDDADQDLTASVRPGRDQLRAVADGDDGDPEAAERQDDRARRSSAEQRRNIEEMNRRQAEKDDPDAHLAKDNKRRTPSPQSTEDPR